MGWVGSGHTKWTDGQLWPRDASTAVPDAATTKTCLASTARNPPEDLRALGREEPAQQDHFTRPRPDPTRAKQPPEERPGDCPFWVDWDVRLVSRAVEQDRTSDTETRDRTEFKTETKAPRPRPTPRHSFHVRRTTGTVQKTTAGESIDKREAIERNGGLENKQDRNDRVQIDDETKIPTSRPTSRRLV